MPRREKKYHFIYKTTNLLSGKYYIGMHSTDNIEDGYLGSGKRLRYSINKYGVKNHKREIIEFVESREELRKKEKEIVNLNEIAKEECMNLMVGGEGGFISEEQQKFRSSAGGKASKEKRKNDLSLFKAHSERSSKSMRKNHEEGKINYNTFFGKKHTEETKKIISDIKKGTGLGELNSQFGTCWITKDGINKKIKKEEINTFIQQGWVKGRK